MTSVSHYSVCTVFQQLKEEGMERREGVCVCVCVCVVIINVL